MSALDQLNVGGITTISVIHQPRYAVFAQFDHLFLLGTGGRMIYQGDPVASQVYFRNLGFFMPEGGNMADFICDIAVGVIECNDDPEFEPHQLFDLWEKHEKKYGMRTTPMEERMAETLETLGPRAHTSPFGTQLLLQLRMGGLIRWRGWFIILLLWNIYGIICMLHPLLMGTFAVDIPDYGPNILTITDLAKYYGAAIAQTFFGQIIAFMILFFTLYCTLSNALFGKTFHENKLIFWRESSSGYSILAFVLAQLILDCVHVVMSAFFCFFVFTEFRQPLVNMPYLWCWFMMLAWGLSGHIYFAQLLFPRKIETLGALVFILVSVHAYAYCFNYASQCAHEQKYSQLPNGTVCLMRMFAS